MRTRLVICSPSLPSVYARSYCHLNRSLSLSQTNLTVKYSPHLSDQALTPAEVVVLRLIAAGNANKQIADQLAITEDTVKGRVKSILAKLDANDRTHAAIIGLKRGIIEL